MKNKTVIAICIQEPKEDGSQMDFGPIDGENVRFLHQAFITDTIISASGINDADIRLYYIDSPERKKLVQIVTDYLTKRLPDGKDNDFLKNRLEKVKLQPERWGIRVENIFNDCFKQGYKNVLVIGSRTPTVTTKMMKTAIKLLDGSDAVFGPTPDGRYYVIGMSGTEHIKLSEFDWKSPTIYSEVAEALQEKDLAWSELEIWYCVERSDELEMAIRDINQFRFEGDELSSLETEKVLDRIITKLEL
jgi:glycosyltransferase A (GT-A) superfamily protein (DUF2064 family)